MTDCKALVPYRPKTFLIATEVEETLAEQRAFAARILKAYLPAAIAEMCTKPIEEIREAAERAMRLFALELCAPMDRKRTRVEAVNGLATIIAGVAACSFCAGGVDFLGEHFEGAHVGGVLDLEGDLILGFLCGAGVAVAEA